MVWGGSLGASVRHLSPPSHLPDSARTRRTNSAGLTRGVLLRRARLRLGLDDGRRASARARGPTTRLVFGAAMDGRRGVGCRQRSWFAGVKDGGARARVGARSRRHRRARARVPARSERPRLGAMPSSWRVRARAPPSDYPAPLVRLEVFSCPAPRPPTRARDGAPRRRARVSQVIPRACISSLPHSSAPHPRLPTPFRSRLTSRSPLRARSPNRRPPRAEK